MYPDTKGSTGCRVEWIQNDARNLSQRCRDPDDPLSAFLRTRGEGISSPWLMEKAWGAFRALKHPTTLQGHENEISSAWPFLSSLGPLESELGWVQQKGCDVAQTLQDANVTWGERIMGKVNSKMLTHFWRIPPWLFSWRWHATSPLTHQLQNSCCVRWAETVLHLYSRDKKYDSRKRQKPHWAHFKPPPRSY